MTADPQWWRDAQDAGVVCLPEQQAVAVYVGGGGAIVIRQEAWNDSDDSVVFVRPENAERVAQAILDAAQEAREQCADTQEPERRKPLTNAERQRRFRRNARNGKNVTRRNESNGQIDTPSTAPDVCELFQREEEQHQLAG
ncbi:hypothetical protein [Methylocystis suflitae]|uniref:hypothetical protein n=1 Tax=Methylocystis suflitae TaxID=2951405 RepID=UPI00210EE65F|nr:hypothetical protein [Methylocystis suflitae]MCQ4191016.1 hypothetical protein [Methylocystis suflitae]